MSGVEVAGLVIGVLPILCEVVKSYSAVRDKVHTFRHCTQEIEDLFVELKVIQVSFLNEVRWIRRSIEDKQQAKIDFEDCDGQRWTSREAEIQLNAILQDNYDAFGEIMRRTKRALEGMAIELEIFDPLLVQKSQGESVRKVYKRLRKALHITFNRYKYDTCLASLRDRNSELCALRSQIVAIEQQDAPLGGICIRHVPVPVHFKTVQNTSRQLHESLCRAWRCDHSSHYGHNAKLCLDADGVNEVILDLAISCHESLGANSPSPSQESTIWLYVQSTSTSPKPQPNTPERQENSNTCTKLAKELLHPDVSSPVKCLKKKASSDLSENAIPKKKLRRVHFEDTTASIALHLPTSNTLFTFGIDLYKTENICDHLRQCYKEQLSAPAKRCIGYLESAQMYKHVFYFRDAALKPGLGNTASATVSTVKQALTQEVYDALQPEDRLRLAHKLAVAMLQYNDTPWLPDRWRLENLNYLGSKVTFDVEAFRTLHFSSQILQSAASAVADSPMEDLQQSKPKVSDETRFGITNTPLFFLGVAMLEIAYWMPIEEKMTEADENNQIFAARRLVLDRGAPLGPEYQRIAQKCLECNFGFGNKLSNKGLQSAVYNDVVCKLDSMIQRLENLSV